MGVLDNQPVNQTITNAAFINKNVDDQMPNKFGLNRPMSGPTIADIQQAVNNVYTATGVSETQTGTNYNATPGTIANGDSHQLALTELAGKFDPATGHFHTGSAGDGPLLDVVRGLAVTGNSPVTGEAVLIAGSNMTIIQSGNDFTFESTGGGGSTTIAASGNSPLTGAVVFVAGANIQLSQSGQNITIAASGGGGGGGSPVNVDIPNESDWISYSPVITATTTNPTPGTFLVNLASWKRIGDSISIRYDFEITNSGAAAGSGTYLFSLPSGLAIDSTKIKFASTIPSTSMGDAGNFAYNDSAGSMLGGWAVAYDSTHFALVAVLSAVSGTYTTAFVGSTDLQFGNAPAQVYSMTVTLPIAGWTTNTPYTINSIAQPAIGLGYNNSSGQSIPDSARTIITNYTLEFDTNSAFDPTTGVFTAPLDGLYSFSGSFMMQSFTATNGEIQLSLNKNGISGFKVIGGQKSPGADTFVDGYGLLSLVAGDTVAFEIFQSGNGGSKSLSSASIQNSISIQSISLVGNIPSPLVSQISLYTSSALGTASGNTTFVYDNVRINTGSDIAYIPDAVNGDSFLINTTGIYAITANIGNQTGGANGLTINNSPTAAFSSSSPTNILNTAQVVSTAQGGGISYTGTLTVGDIVRVQSSSSTDSINGTTYENIFTITKIETVATPITIPSPFQFFASSPITTQSSALTSTSFTTFSNSPAFTFTPGISGTYKIYSPISVQVAAAGSSTNTIRVFNTSGGASLLYESRSDFFSFSTQNEDANSVIQSVYSLVAGTSYVFDIQGMSPGGSTIFLGAGTTDQQFYMFAERVQ